MINTNAKTCFLAGLLISFAALSGCSSHERTTGDSTGTAQKKATQLHTGKLFVSILPESPTSSDDLQAVVTKGGAVIWHWEKNGRILDNETIPRLMKTRFERGDVISVTASLAGQEGTASVTIANSPPEIKSVRFTPDSICRGVDITAVPEGVDADGDAISYGCKWIINGIEAAEDTLILKGDKIKKGDSLSAIITPQDSYGTGKTFKTQTVSIPNATPCFITTPPAGFKGKVYTYTASAQDPDSDAITYSLVSSPPGMVIDNKSGRITWPITKAFMGSTTVEIEAQDSEGAKAIQKYSLNITLPPEGNN